jgi:hypothetical protein
MEEGLQIPVSFTLEEARAALKELEQAARAAGKKIGDGLDPGGGGGGGGGANSGGLFKMKEGMGRAREAAMFFSQSLSGFGESGRLAQTAIAGVAGAFLGGGGLLFALEGAKVAFSLMAASTEETSKRMEDLERRSVELIDRAKGRVEDLRTQLLRLEQGEAGVMRSRFAAERAQLTTDIDNLRRELQANMLPWNRARMEQELAYLERRRDALQKTFVQEFQQQRALASATKQKEDDEKAAAKAKEDAQKAEAQWLADIRAAEDARWRAGAVQREAEKLALDLVNDKAAQGRAAVGDLTKMVDDAQAGLNAVQFGAILPLGPGADGQFDQAMRSLEAYQAAIDATREKLRGMAEDAVRSFGGAVAGELGKVMRTSRAYEQAMRAAGKASGESADFSAAAFAAMTQNVLASVAERAVVESLFEFAMGLRDSAMGLPTAAGHFASSKMFAATAAVAGVAAAAIGQTRGMTAAERESVGGATDTGSSAAPREVGAPDASGRRGPTIIVNFSGRALVTEPEVKRYLADLLQETKDSGWIN